MARLRFESVTKVYDSETVAVNEFGLEIADGEFIALVGPSGSGKSTLLRMVAGLEEVTDGTIRIGDRAVNRVPPRNRDIAMVFQSYALYPHLSVYENMAFGLRRSGEFDDEQIDERVREAADLMGIHDLLEQRPKQLSGGQRQRVATGRAIVRDPAVFLFDEPLSNLDAKLRKHMRIEIQRLQNTLDTTTIYVTHDQEEAMTMSDRIAILDHGELQQIGSPREVYTEPVNQFVAQFIGSPSMNLFDVDIEPVSGASRFTGDVEFDLDRPLARAGSDEEETEDERLSGQYRLGIRPEHLSVQRESTPESFPVHVDIVEPLGSNDLLYFTLDDREENAGSERSSEVDERKLFVEPDTFAEDAGTVHVTVDPSHLHVFDPASGENVGPTAPQQELHHEAAPHTV